MRAILLHHIRTVERNNVKKVESNSTQLFGSSTLNISNKKSQFTHVNPPQCCTTIEAQYFANGFLYKIDGV